MKYTIINELSSVNFHDAKIHDIYFRDNRMIWELPVVQAPEKYISGRNIYIKDALMIFENARIENIFIGGCGKTDKNGDYIVIKESVTVPPDEYSDIIKAMQYGQYEIFCMKEFVLLNDERYKASFAVSRFDITVTFTESVLKWDEFGSREWFDNKVW